MLSFGLDCAIPQGPNQLVSRRSDQSAVTEAGFRLAFCFSTGFLAEAFCNQHCGVGEKHRF
jgi:hypothetical protein